MNKIQAELGDWGQLKRSDPLRAIGYREKSTEGRIMEIGNVRIGGLGMMTPDYWPDSKLAYLDFLINDVLEPDYLGVIYLKYQESYKVDKIKVILGVSRRTVYNYLEDAENILNSAMKKRFGNANR
jgi:hypothetical protein